MTLLLPGYKVPVHDSITKLCVHKLKAQNKKLYKLTSNQDTR